MFRRHRRDDADRSRRDSDDELDPAQAGEELGEELDEPGEVDDLDEPAEQPRPARAAGRRRAGAHDL
ncbi:MAG TPA: hypothetical protein VGH88_11755, partial [Streptosporangiaceae bacterium]